MRGRAAYLRGGLFLGLTVGAWLAAESASAQTRPLVTQGSSAKKQPAPPASKGTTAPKGGGNSGSATPTLPSYRYPRPVTSYARPLSSPSLSTVTSGVPLPWAS